MQNKKISYNKNMQNIKIFCNKFCKKFKRLLFKIVMQAYDLILFQIFL